MNKFISLLACFFGLAHVCDAGTVGAFFASSSTVSVTSASYTATGNDVSIILGFAPPAGTNLTIIKNTGLSFINGQFTNLAHGQTVDLSYGGKSYRFVANYYGGTGNDLVLRWAYQNLVAWGSGDAGELGDGRNTTISLAVSITQSGILAGKTVLSVAAGSKYSLALCSNGTLAAWGENTSGQLGNNSTTNSSVPVLVDQSGVLAGKIVISVATGGSHSLALCSDGTLVAWGLNSLGQLGNNSTTNSSVPVLVTQSGVLAGKTVVAVTAGYQHSIALCSDGTLAAWGRNINGQLGNNSTTNSSVPVLVTQSGVLAGKTVISVVAGDYHSFALCSDGTLAAWGLNNYGVLGNNTTVSSYVPVLVTQSGVLAGKTIISVAAGYQHSLALCSDGTLAAWGRNYYGQLGNNGVYTVNSSVPVLVDQSGVLVDKTVISVAAGYEHNLALCSDGTLVAWGHNNYAQLGNSTTTDSKVPVLVTQSGVLAGKFVAAITVGDFHNITLFGGQNTADLSGLSLSESDLNPTFASNATSYSVSVTSPVITVKPTVVDASATVKVNGISVTPGIDSPPLPLELGSNIITILVTARDGTTTATYTITVTRVPLVANFSSPSSIPVTATSYTATGSEVPISLGFAPSAGTNLTIINNTGLSFIGGQFSNLAHGQTVDLSYSGKSYRFVANYYGGTGNDLVLHWAYQDLAAWGFRLGLGNGSTTNISVPVLVNQSGALAGKTVVSAAAGANHSLALCSDGTLAAWGINNSGELGAPTPGGNFSSMPVLVDQSGVLAGKTVVAVAAGYEHSIALCSDGTIAAWGANSYGQLGNSSTTNSSIPVLVDQGGVLAGKTVVAVTAGSYHNVALCSDGTLVAWGNYLGLGNGNPPNSSVPVLVNQSGVLAGKTVTSMAAGYAHSLALCSDGNLVAWGLNRDGQLGNGFTSDSMLPVLVNQSGVLGDKTVVSVASGNYHNLALCSDGTVAAWGKNGIGQLGNNTTTNSSVPALVTQSGVLAGKTVAAVAAGSDHSLVLCSDGTLAAWGYNNYGQLGNNSTTTSSVPVLVNQTGVLAGKTVVSGAAGGYHSLALAGSQNTADLSGLSLSEGDLNPVFASGTTSYSASATGAFITVKPTVVDQMATVKVDGISVIPGVDSPPLSLAMGPNTITVLVTARDGTTTATYTITVTRVSLVANFSSPSSIPVTASSYTTTGDEVAISLGFAPPSGTNLTVIKNTGLSFINGRFSNLAHGQTVDLSYGGKSYRFVANYYGGTGNDLVLHWAYQDLTAWGGNSFGQLGNNSTTDSNVPVPVTQSGALLAKTVLSVAVGDEHSLALCSDGTIAAWGRNSSGQLGNNSVVNSSVPVLVNQSGVLAGKTVVAVAAGSSHSLALCSDATLVAWGINNYGQLGNGGTTNSSVPVLVTQSGVLAGETVVSVAAGNGISLALCSDGTVAAWGLNSWGQLGNGGTTNSSDPVLVTQSGVLAGKTVVSLAAGTLHNLALCSDGTLTAWGLNTSGQLGDNSTTNRSTPVLVTQSGVLTGKTVISVAAGQSYSLALCLDGSVATWGNSPGNSALVPVLVDQSGVLTGKTVVSVAAGQFHSLALCSDGTLVAWGTNFNGGLGNGGVTSSNVPVLVNQSGVQAGKTVVAVAAGKLQSLALAGGKNSADLSELSLSEGDLNPAFAPETTNYSVSVSSPAITVRPIATGAAAEVTVNGIPVTSGTDTPPLPLVMGSNTITVLVTGWDGNSRTYTIVVTREPLVAHFSSLSSVPVTEAAYNATGRHITISLGFAAPTGSNLTIINNTGLPFISGQFLNLTHGQTVDLYFDGKPYRFVANYYGGTGNDLVLHWAYQDLAAWGLGASGQLGSNSTNTSSVPVLVTQSGVLAGKTVVSVSVGSNHSLALCSDGTLASWGLNASGQLGNNSVVNSSVPVLVNQSGVLAGKTVISVAAGNSHSLALCSDGTLASWGLNSSGQLGNNSTTNGSTPVLVTQSGVLSGKTVISVAAGNSHNLVLCADGALASWGLNSSGQLGNNSTTNRSTPLLVTQSGVLSGKTVVSVAVGNSHNLVLCSDGTLAAWGLNTSGQLGNGSTTNSSVPVLVTQSGVLASKSVVSVAAGESHSLALTSVRNSAYLSGLSLSYGDLNPAFAAGTTIYSVSVTNEAMTVSPTLEDTLATVKVNGISVTSGSNSPLLSLVMGQNIITVLVTAWDGTTENTYTIIVERVSGYDFWKKGIFTLEEQNDPSICGATATPAGDGITNLMKYALCLDPNASGVANMPTVAPQDGYLTLTYRRNKLASDLTYTVQVGAELSTTEWSEAATVVSQTDEGDYWLVTVRDNVIQADHPKRFMRLKINK
jgi:alpha-tubulin suppressor-like RCC1 family protein